MFLSDNRVFVNKTSKTKEKGKRKPNVQGILFAE